MNRIEEYQYEFYCGSLIVSTCLPHKLAVDEMVELDSIEYRVMGIVWYIDPDRLVDARIDLLRLG